MKEENVERDVVLDEKEGLQKLVEKRIEQNKKIFTEQEIEIILSNNILANKLYLLGILDAKF